MVDIKQFPGLTDQISAVLSRGGTVEVKLEKRDGKERIALVETRRSLKSTTPI